MKKFWRILKISLGALLSLTLLAVVAVYALSSYRLNRTHAVPVLPTLKLSNDPAVVGRGGHIVTSFGMCTECHGPDLGGNVFVNSAALGVVAGLNLTPGQGGIGATMTNDDWVRAIRHGVKPDGTSLVIMPSEVFAHFTEDDLTAVVSYLKQLPPVNRVVPPVDLPFLGRTLLALGKLPVLVAEKTPKLPLVKRIDQTPSVAYGHYLAIGCRSCHRANLSGGSVQKPGSPPSSNLTPAGPTRTWSEADFVRTLRTGVRPNGTTLHPQMPWRQAGMMTDDELHAIWLYLRSVPPTATGTP